MNGSRKGYHKVHAERDIKDPIVKVSIGLRSTAISRLDDVANENLTSRSLLVQEAVDRFLEEEG